MVDPNLISLGLLGLSVLQTVALAWIAAKYGTAVQSIAAKSAGDSADRASDDARASTAAAERRPPSQP